MSNMSLFVGMFVFFGLFLSVISIPLIYKKIKPNGLYGFRVKKTMENPDIWYAVNAYAGKWFLADGLVLALSAIGLSLIPSITLDIFAYWMLAIFVVVFGVSMVFSVRYMNSL